MRILSARSLLLLVIFCGFAAEGSFKSERAHRVGKLRGFLNGVTESLLPGFVVGAENCAAQLASIRLPVYDETVFNFRIVTLLSEGIATSDPRPKLAFAHLGILQSSIRNWEGATSVLPKPSIQLGADVVYDGDVEPRTLAYAARGLLSFAEANQNSEAREKASALWKTLRDRYSAPTGAMVTSINPSTHAKSNMLSHASVVYPWTASGFKLLKLLQVNPSPELTEHEANLKAAVRAGLAMLRRDQLPFESLNAKDLLPFNESPYKFYGQDEQVSILGHYAQLLNFLLRAEALGVQIPKAELPASIQGEFVSNGELVDISATVLGQLRFLLRAPFFDEKSGQILNGFFQRTGQLVWNDNRAFWQQCEFVALLNRALVVDLFKSDEDLLLTVRHAFLKATDSLQHYFDGRRPVAAVINGQLGPDQEDAPFMVPIMGYHLVDLLDQVGP